MQYLPLSPRKMSRISNIRYMSMYTHKICFYENLNKKLVSEIVKNTVWYVTIQSSRWCYHNIFANLYFPSLLLHDHLPQKYLSDLKKTSNLGKIKTFFFVLFLNLWRGSLKTMKKISQSQPSFIWHYIFVFTNFLLLSHLLLFNTSSGYKNTNKHPGSSKLSSDCVPILRVYFAAQWTLRTKGQLLTFSPLEGAHTYFAKQESVNNESERALHNRVPKKKIPWKKMGLDWIPLTRPPWTFTEHITNICCVFVYFYVFGNNTHLLIRLSHF